MIKAFGKRIIAKAVDLTPPKKEGIIIVPNKEYHATATVVAFGKDVDSGIAKGDIIYIEKRDGSPVEINGEMYLSLHEHSIIAAWKGK